MAAGPRNRGHYFTLFVCAVKSRQGVHPARDGKLQRRAIFQLKSAIFLTGLFFGLLHRIQSQAGQSEICLPITGNRSALPDNFICQPH